MSGVEQNKVAVFVCNDLIGLVILNGVIPRMIAQGFEPVIFHTGDHRNRTFKVPTPPAVSFFNVGLLRDTIIPHLEENPAGDAPLLTYRQLIQKHGLESHDITDVNDPALVNSIIDDERFCGAISERFLQVFEHEIINVFREKGFFWNLHSGLLPNYKGLLTPYPAIENGEKTYGLTMHDMTRRLDEGGIVRQTPLPLDPSKPIFELYLDTVQSGIEMIDSALAEYKANGYVISTPQPAPTKKDYHTNPTAEEFRAFMAKGIIYADPASMPNIITGLFFGPGANMLQSARFKNVITDAITGPLTVPIITPTGKQNAPDMV